MRTFNALIYRGLQFLLTALIAVMIIPVTLQIFSRFVDFIPRYIWTEEVARFCLIWLIMLGATIAVRDGTHFDVDVLPHAEDRARRRRSRASSCMCAMLLVALIFIAFGWRFALFGWDQSSEMTGINMLCDPRRLAVRRHLLAPVPGARRSSTTVKLYAEDGGAHGAA